MAACACGDHRVTVQILHVADCPLVEELRDLLRSAAARAGVSTVVEEVEGPCLSPTLLVGGVEVSDGAVARPSRDAPACRLDLPTEDQIVAALVRA